MKTDLHPKVLYEAEEKQEEICAKCGFTENSHNRKNFFNKEGINMVFADKLGKQPCEKFTLKSFLGFEPYESDIITGDPLPKNHSPLPTEKEAGFTPIDDLFSVEEPEGTQNQEIETDGSSDYYDGDPDFPDQEEYHKKGCGKIYQVYKDFQSPWKCGLKFPEGDIGLCPTCQEKEK